MEEINTLLDLDWKGFVATLFIIMASLIAVHEIMTRFAKMIKKIVNRIRGIQSHEKDDKQDDEIESIKNKQKDFENALGLIKENMMIATWDRIIHFGMNYIERGHITYSEKDIFIAQTKSYSNCGGNGHLAGFVPRVDELPYTEDLTQEEIAMIETNSEARKRRLALASASLSAYYGK